MAEVASAVQRDFGSIDVLVHSLANGPEVTKPLLETSRKVCARLLQPPQNLLSMRYKITPQDLFRMNLLTGIAGDCPAGGCICMKIIADLPCGTRWCSMRRCAVPRLET